MITKIQIKNFRSIVSAEIQATGLTVFVGANDAGKSNVLRALNLFFNGETDHKTPFAFARDFNQFAKVGIRKARQIEVKITFKLPDSYSKGLPANEVEWQKIWRSEGELARLENQCFVGGAKISARSKIPTLLDRIKFTYIPAIKDSAFFTDLQGRLYDVLSSVAAEPLKLSAGQFEQQIELQLRELLESINASFKSESKMRMPENLRQVFESLEINNDNVPLSRRGDGIKVRHIPMILKFLSDKRDQLLNRGGVRYSHVWGFEEPENNVEMAASFDMAREFRKVAGQNEQFQLFITTHSPVFYRMGLDQSDLPSGACTHYVAKIATETLIASKNIADVDSALGLMDLVSPFVSEAKQRYDEIKKQLNIVKGLASKSQPTILVEGESDRIALQAAWLALSEHSAEHVTFHDGGADSYGSANALASRALAWALETRHSRNSDSAKAIAIFDADEAGQSAKKNLSDQFKVLGLEKSQNVRFFCLTRPKSLRDIATHGIELPSDLEAHYSDKLWQKAQDEGWLEAISDTEVLARLHDDLAAKIIVSQMPLPTLSTSENLRFRFRFSPAGKSKAARYISRLSVEEAKDVLRDLSVIVKRAESFFFEKTKAA